MGRTSNLPAPKAEAPKVCGVVGLPNGEKKVCELEAGHADDYHRDGTTRWIGYWPKAEAPMTLGQFEYKDGATLPLRTNPDGAESLADRIISQVNRKDIPTLGVRGRVIALLDRFALSIAAAARKEAEEEIGRLRFAAEKQGCWECPSKEERARRAEHSRQALAEALRPIIKRAGQRGCAGKHRGPCGKGLHHHHDERCDGPTLTPAELHSLRAALAAHGQDTQ